MLTVERYNHVGWKPGLIADSAALMTREYASRFGVGVAYEAWVTSELAGFFSAFEPDRSEWWTARLDGRLVGCGAVDGRRGHGVEAEFRWFCLAPACRGQGVGRRMLAEAVEWAAQRGLQRLRLDTHQDLRAAVHLYREAGFRLLGRRSGPGWAPHLRFDSYELALGAHSTTETRPSRRRAALESQLCATVR